MDWLIQNHGHREMLCESQQQPPLSTPYRLYRFLTDLEDILETVQDDQLRLQLIAPLVRHLLSSSTWLQWEFLPPDPELGWSAQILYEEPDFPLTIQTVAWLPGNLSPIHNHGTWGVVALISGQEKNTFWRQIDNVNYPERIEQVETYTLSAGEILCLMPEAIHQVEPLGEDPVISFNLYGETDFQRRFEFDPIAETVRRF